MLRLHTFGSCLLTRDGARVDALFGQRKALAPWMTTRKLRIDGPRWRVAFGRQPENSMGPDLLRSWMFPALMSTAVAFAAATTDLTITDARGAQVVVTGATIDYGGLLATDKATDGIRVLQGEGLVLLKWSTVDTLRVTKVDESVRPPRIDLEVVLRNRKRVPATLLRKGRMQLLGKTDLGDYAIGLDKIRVIVPVR